MDVLLAGLVVEADTGRSVKSHRIDVPRPSVCSNGVSCAK